MTRAPRAAEPSAAVASLAAIVQPRGPWMGRRHLAVRFAGEAETATLFTAGAFAAEIERLAGRSRYHALALGGHDVVAHAVFLQASWAARRAPVPVLLETDGQRPEAIAGLRDLVQLVQVQPPALTGATVDRVMETLHVAAGIGREHALVLEVNGGESDGQLLRLVELAHRASAGTIIVVHPPPGEGALSRRWAGLLEQAAAVHDDVRLLPTLPG